MCMADDCDEWVQLIRSGDPVAKKEHKCAECFRLIRAGEKYHTDTYYFDGGLTHHKTCAHCMVVRDWLQSECGGFLYGGVEEDIREHADNGMYGFGVKVLAVGMARNWMRRDGRRWPIPRLPKTTHEKMAPSK